MVAVTLGQLEDDSNARLAYKQAVALDTKDPSVCLNYAIFLLRQGDKAEASEQYSAFEARVLKLRHSTDLDSQVRRDLISEQLLPNNCLPLNNLKILMTFEIYLILLVN